MLKNFKLKSEKNVQPGRSGAGKNAMIVGAGKNAMIIGAGKNAMIVRNM